MLLFLYGPDIYGKNKKLKQIAARFVKEHDPSRLNLQTLDADICVEEDLRQALNAPPFLTRKRLVVVKNFITKAKRKEFHEILEEALPRLRDDTTVIVSEDADKPKKQNSWKNQTAKKVWEYLEKNAKREKFSRPSGTRLEAAIADGAKARGLAFEQGALAMLAAFSEGDLSWIENEIEKLKAYCGALARTGEENGVEEKKGFYTINAEHIKTLCVAESEANMFEFLDAIGNKERITLLRVFEKQLRESPLLHIIGRASKHLSNILTVILAGNEGARALKLQPFAVGKVIAQARKWKATELKRFLFALTTIEYQIKSGKSANPQAQLTTVFLQYI